MSSAELRRVAEALDRYEASESVANTGTGTRREGEKFEHLVRELWTVLADQCVEAGAERRGVVRAGTHAWVGLTVAERTLFLPAATTTPGPAIEAPPAWFQLAFRVSDQVDERAVAGYAPALGPYAGARYPDMYARMTTCFDDTIVLDDGGVLHDKVLLEYKSAKSSLKKCVDGNAHERLSYQVMEYLEIAVRHRPCSLLVVANGAFARYRNKYHLGFRVQADRLASRFPEFSMQHACTAPEYEARASSLALWLRSGAPERAMAPG